MQRIMIALLAVMFFVGFNAAAFADDKAKGEAPKAEMKGDAKKDTKGAEKKEEKKDKKAK
jgi:Ni/Co efflux regulator RcnB